MMHKERGAHEETGGGSEVCFLTSGQQGRRLMESQK